MNTDLWVNVYFLKGADKVLVNWPQLISGSTYQAFLVLKVADGSQEGKGFRVKNGSVDSKSFVHHTAIVGISRE